MTKKKQSKPYQSKQQIARINQVLARKSIEFKKLDEQTKPHIERIYEKKEKIILPEENKIDLNDSRLIWPPEKIIEGTYIPLSFIKRISREINKHHKRRKRSEIEEKFPLTKEIFERFEEKLVKQFGETSKHDIANPIEVAKYDVIEEEFIGELLRSIGNSLLEKDRNK